MNQNKIKPYIHPIFYSIFLLFSVYIFFFVSTVSAAPRAEIIVDARTGNILAGHEMRAIRHPASLTKIMTLYMAFDAIERGRFRPDTPLKVSAYAAGRSPSKLGLPAGSTIPMKDAIYGLVTKSANDAASVLAEAIGGSESNFAIQMTQKARQIGMRNTTFKNASGLPNKDQVTTAFDMAILASRLMTDFPDYYSLFSRSSFTYKGRVHANHNHLMKRYPGMDGIKTGFIFASGFNLVASAEREGRRIIGVIFGGNTARSRDNRMEEMLDNGFRILRTNKIVSMGNIGRQVTQMALLKDTHDPLSGRKRYGAVTTDRLEPRDDRPPLKPILQNNNQAPSNTIPYQAVAKIITSSPSPKGSPSSSAAITTNQGWAVQVGAFSQKNSAESYLASLKQKHQSEFVNADTSIVATLQGKDMLYRARFVGYSKEQANSVCSRLKSQKRTCIPIALKD